MKKISLTASLALLFLLPSCSLRSSNSESEAVVEETTLEESAEPVAEAKEEAAKAVADTAPASEEVEAAVDAVSEAEETQALSSVEILWQVPGEAVEYYYLRYGVDSANLGSKEKIAVKDIEKLDHPEHGPLFRHVISGVPAAETIYFTIQAENQFGLSPESPVQEVDSE